MSAAEDFAKIDAALERELRGEQLEFARPANGVSSAVRLPIGPFREWLLKLQAEEKRLRPGAKDKDAQGALATRIGVAPRTVRRYLDRRNKLIDEVAVDRACCREGSVSLWDLYPEQCEFVAEELAA